MSDLISDNPNPESIGSDSHGSLISDAQLDLFLKGYLAGALDGQVGRSELAFARLVGAEAESPRRHRIGMVGMGIAAAILLVGGLGLAALERHEKPLTAGIQPAPAPLETTPAFSPSESQTFVDAKIADMGTLQVDGSPFHAYRREMIQRTESFDPKTKSRLEITTPSDEIILVGLKEY